MDFNDYWWIKKEDSSEEIFRLVKQIYNNQSGREAANKQNLRLYGNLDIFGTAFSDYNREEKLEKVTLNIIQSMCDTIQSKMVKNKPKPTFLSDGGDWTLQTRAKKLTKFCEGQFYQTKIYNIAPKILLDCLIFGTGFLKVYRQEGKIKIERVFPNNIYVDDRESLYGKARSMYQTHFIHKEVLKEMYPKLKSFIENAKGEHDKILSNDQSVDMVKVVEAWHLPSGPKAKDGRHAICIDNKELFIENWNKDYFPFVELRWSERQLGFYGQGLSEQLTGMQREINKTLKTIQLSIHLGCVPKIFVEAGSKVVKSHFSNKIGGIIEFAGKKPTYEQLMSVPPELLSHLKFYIENSYEIAGVSQLSARSKKPSGLDSGVALREYNDIESERFLAFGQRYEQFFLDAAVQMIDLAREIDAESKEDYKVQVKGKDFFDTIKWKDVSLENDKYMMQLFPTNSLSQLPSARKQEVTELIQAGMINKEFGLKLLDFPDLEEYTSTANAAIEDIHKIVEHFVEFEYDDENIHELYIPPEPYQNLQLGIDMMQSAYLKYKLKGLPEERLELFRNWIEDANDRLAKMTQAAMPPEPVLDDGTGVPLDNPVSDLMPLPTEGV